jgi:hypothetical protein
MDKVGVVISAGTSSSIGIGIIGGAAISSLGDIGILTFVAIAALAVLLGFVIIVLREILIVFLAVLAPIAIAMFILPATSKVWKLWWNTFFKALLMFPLITAIIAIGRVFAAISSQNGGTIGQFIAFIAYFGPYFIIPQTFKFAGGILGAAGGMAAGVSKSFNKAMAGARARERKQNAESGAQGMRFRHGKQTGVSGLLNRTTMGIATGPGGHFGIGSKGRDNMERVQRDRDAANLASNKTLDNLGQNSAEGIAILAASGGTLAGAKLATESLKQMMIKNAEAKDPHGDRAAIEAKAESDSQKGFHAAQGAGINTSNSRAAFSVGAANKWRALSGNGTGQFLSEGLDRAYQGSDQLKGDALQSLAYNNRRGGRSDIGGIDSATNAFSASDGFAKAGAQAVARDFDESLLAQKNRIVTDFKTAKAAGNTIGATDAAAQLGALRNAMGPDLSLKNQKIINDGLTEAGLDTSSKVDIVTQLAGQIPRSSSTPALTDAQMANIINNRIGAYTGPQMGAGGRTPGMPSSGQQDGDGGNHYFGL